MEEGYGDFEPLCKNPCIGKLSETFFRSIALMPVALTPSYIDLNDLNGAQRLNDLNGRCSAITLNVELELEPP